MKFFSFCHKTWQPRGTLSQFGALLYYLIACIGSDWRGVSVPAWGSSYPDSPFGSWHALFSNNFFILHTGFFIGAYGRLMKAAWWTKVVSEGSPSLHCMSLATRWLAVEWWVNHTVFFQWMYFGDVPCSCGQFQKFPAFFISSCRSQIERDVPNISTKVRTHRTKCLCIFIWD